MIQTELLQYHIRRYLKRCRRFGVKPSYSGLASELGCCTMTVLNVVRGTYSQGKPYTETPSATRIIKNDDFELLQALFKG